MRKSNAVQNLVLVVLALALLVMSVGYAVYNQTLSINGTATFEKAVWDVHFDTSTFTETSTIQATSTTVGNTSISYTVTLEKPGDEYSFSVNAKNFGTIDAKLTGITLAGVTAAYSEFVEYTVSYNGTTYSATTTGLNIPLNANASAPVIVTVTYKLPANSADLPSADVTVNLTASLDYESVA